MTFSELLMWTGTLTFALLAAAIVWLAFGVVRHGIVTTRFVWLVTRRTHIGWFRFWWSCFWEPPDHVSIQHGGVLYWPGREPHEE